MREPEVQVTLTTEAHHEAVVSATAPMHSDEHDGGVPCTYCRESIALSAFAFRSSIHQLISGKCPHCDKRVTIKTPQNAQAVADWAWLPQTVIATIDDL